MSSSFIPKNKYVLMKMTKMHGKDGQESKHNKDCLKHIENVKAQVMHG